MSGSPHAATRGEPGREIGDEGAKRRAVPVAQCVALALDERRDRPGEGRAAPVRQSQAEQLVGPRRPGRLETDEAVDHREPLGDRGVVAVVAGHLVEQRPRTVAPEHARDGHGPARERLEQRPLVREERRDDLEPRRAAGRSRAATGSRGSTSGPAAPARPAAGRSRPGRCPPTRGRRRDRRVVPRSAAAGRPGGRRPRREGGRRADPASPPRRPRRLGEVRHVAAGRVRAIGPEQPQHRHVHAEPLAGAVHDRPDVLPPGRRGLERRQRTEDRPALVHEDQVDDAGRGSRARVRRSRR